MEIKIFLHKSPSKRSFRHRIHSLVRRADAKESAHIYKRFESVKMLQIQFDTMDFSHLYDFCRWNFWSSLLKNVIFGVIF